MRVHWPAGALLGVILAPACAPESVVYIDGWRLDVGDGSGENVLRLPTHLTAVLPDKPSRYWLRAEVILPEEMRHRTLTLAIPHLMARASLRVGKHEVPELGESLWEGYRGEGPHRWRIAPSDETRLKLELQVEHRWTLSGWIDSVPRLSATSRGDRNFRTISLFNYWSGIAGATSSIIGALYLFIFLLDRRQVGHAWFGIGALAASYYSLFWVGVTQPIFGTLEGAGIVATLSVALISAVYFLHASFKLGKPPRLLGLAAALHVIFATLLRDPFMCVSILARPMVVLAFVIVVYQIVVLAKLRRHPDRPRNVNIVLACWIAVGVTAWPDFVGWFGYGMVLGGLHSGSLGITIYVALQLAALSREHTAHFREIEELNAELKHKMVQQARELSKVLTSIALGKSRGAGRESGEVIREKYRILGAVGSGGMGVVYAAERIRDARFFALKVLGTRPHPSAVARFSREAAILATLNHPNIVAFEEFGITEEGDPFLVMELVNGTTLNQQRQRFGDLTWAVRVIRQMTAGLEAIHLAGLVHRDLKPGNVLLDYSPVSTEPVVKIADFGISGLFRKAGPDETLRMSVDEGRTSTALPSMSPGGVGLTNDGEMFGTPKYMAPEVRDRGAFTATPASDMFSFGLIAFEILSGRFREGRVSVGDVCPQAPHSLVSLVDRCLADDPAIRPTVSEFSRA